MFFLIYRLLYYDLGYKPLIQSVAMAVSGL